MKINKQLLEEIILEVIKEQEAELDEAQVFGGVVDAARGAASRLGLTRGKKGGPSPGAGIEDSPVAMAAADTAQATARFKTLLSNTQVQKVLERIAGAIGGGQQASSQMKARDIVILLAQLGVGAEMAIPIGTALRGASTKKAAKSDKMAATLPRPVTDDNAVNPMRQRKTPKQQAGQAGRSVAEQIRRLKEELQRLESAPKGKRRSTIRIKRKK